MPSAEQIFRARLQAFAAAAEDRSAMTVSPALHEENARAQIIRNGLAVICFSILEDFLRKRAIELLSRIGSTGVQFAHLSEDLRRLFTVRAIQAAAFQLRFFSPSRDDVIYVQTLAQQIASTANAPFDACEVCFGYSGANIDDADVEMFLRSLGIDKPWETLGYVAARGGIGSLHPGAREAFKRLARQRHEAAHNPQANIQPSDLHASLRNSLGIAFGFDAVASSAVLRMRVHDREVIAGRRKITSRDVVMRVVREGARRRFGHRLEKASRFTRTWATVEEALVDARNTAMREQSIVVLQNAKQLPERWELPALT